MNCPKCKSDDVTEATAETFRCNGCDYSWLPYNTAPRFADAGVKKTESAGPLLALIVITVLIAVALGFVSMFAAVVVGIFGLLAAILYYLARIAAK